MGVDDFTTRFDRSCPLLDHDGTGAEPHPRGSGRDPRNMPIEGDTDIVRRKAGCLAWTISPRHRHALDGDVARVDRPRRYGGRSGLCALLPYIEAISELLRSSNDLQRNLLRDEAFVPQRFDAELPDPSDHTVESIRMDLYVEQADRKHARTYGSDRNVELVLRGFGGNAHSDQGPEGTDQDTSG